MTLEETVLKHIQISLLGHPWLMENTLLERQGVPDIVIGIVERLCNIIDEKRQQGKFHFTITKSDFNGVETFFDECSIKVNWMATEKPRKSDGGYYSKLTKFDNATKKIKNANFIFVLRFTKYDSAKRLTPLFYHEFTHAYEDYRRMLGTAKTLYQQSTDTKYYLNQQNRVGGILSCCKKVIYFLNPSERHAFMSMIRGELEQINPNSASEAMEYLKNSRLWKMVEQVENNITEIMNVEDEGTQNAVVRYFQDNGYPSVKNFRQLKKSLERYWFNFKEKAGKVAGKQIYWQLEDLKNGMTDFSADSGY